MVDEDESSGVTDDLDLNGIDTEDKMKKLWKQANDAVKSAKKTEEAREKQEAELKKMADNLLRYEEKERRSGLFKGGQSPTSGVESEADRSRRGFSQEAETGGSAQLFGGVEPENRREGKITTKMKKTEGISPFETMDEDRLKFLANEYHTNKKIQDHYIGMFHLDNEEIVLTMIRRGSLLIAGGSTNCGLIEEYEFTIDNTLSIDENMQLFVDEINNLELIKN